MRFEDISGSSKLNILELQPIIQNCSQFLQESGNFPLLKNLSDQYSNVTRVKVRQMKPKEIISDSYNDAFGEQFNNLRERAVFASSRQTVPFTSQETYYIFPVDGYKFLYNKEVQDSGLGYQSIINLMMERQEEREAIEMISSILKFTYRQDNLLEGIESGAEIILYHLPHFYAVKTTAVQGYDKLLSTIARGL